MRYLLLALAPLAAPVAAQTLPVTCNAAGTICTQATPVTNPDGTLVGAGGGAAPRTTAPGTSDTQAIPVQGVTNGVPQRITGVGTTTSATGQTVVPASDTAPFPVTQRGSSSLVTTQVSIGTTATLVVAARVNRWRVVLTQSAAGPCYYGPTATVSATTGARLTAAGASKPYQYAGALYGICPSGAVTTDVDEEF